MINVFRDQPRWIPEEDTEMLEWLDIIFSHAEYQVVTDITKSDVSFITNLQVSQVFHDLEVKASLIEYYAQHNRLVFIIETEINTSIVNLIKSVRSSNIVWVVPGFVQHCTNTIHYGWHINQTTKVFNLHPLALDPYSTKPKMFDALLGTNKPHRNYLFDTLINKGLDDKIILKYHGIHNTQTLVDTEHFAWDNYSRPFDNQVIVRPDGTQYYKTDVTHSTENVEYFGQSVRLSQIIPESVYNKSAYSIITESFINNDFTFYTEKITKALLGRRLFVVISGVGYLENLRRLGFKTFENVIDESYDQVEDDKKRFDMVIEQIEQLLQKDQVEVLLKIKDICEHNYELVMSGSLHTAMLDGIRNKINE